MVDEAGDQFVAYFLPTEETLIKRATDGDANVDYTEEEIYDYKLGNFFAVVHLFCLFALFLFCFVFIRVKMSR